MHAIVHAYKVKLVELHETVVVVKPSQLGSEAGCFTGAYLVAKVVEAAEQGPTQTSVQADLAQLKQQLALLTTAVTDLANKPN